MSEVARGYIKKPDSFEDITEDNIHLLSPDEAAQLHARAIDTDVAIDFRLRKLTEENRRLTALRIKIGSVLYLLVSRASERESMQVENTI